MRPDELDALVAEVDTDGSGQIEFDEFLQVWLQGRKLVTLVLLVPW
jgi:Ca2+-binding EF-hand superfamily protein